MRLSICIPVYNHDIRPLAGALIRQMGTVGGVVGLICIDDGSEDRFRLLNRELCGPCTYVELEANVGRSRIRNLFVEKTEEECDFLLFMDCDLMTADEHFLARYVEAARDGADVVVGGHVYPTHCADKECLLQYRNGVSREVRTAAQRNRDPYRSFMTGNFMIRRELLKRIPFDEKIEGYGHEDTLMGYRLKQAGAKVVHIDNPLVAESLETNERYLDKTRSAVANLVKISERIADPEFDRQVTLLRWERRLEKTGLAGIMRRLLGMTQKRREQTLLKAEGGNVGLLMYKMVLCLEERHRCRQ